jgi:Chorismate synthase
VFFEIGSGFHAANMQASEHNDAFINEGALIKTKTNQSGGTQGGISNGEIIYFNVAFKPTATIHKTQQTVTDTGNPVNLNATGRHDPCVLPRAVPIVDSMAALVLADHSLRNRSAKL